MNRYNFKIVEKKWQNYIDKKDPQIKAEFKKNYIDSDLGELEQLIEKEKKNILKRNKV